MNHWSRHWGHYNLLSLAFPVFLLQIYDRIIPSAAISTLFLLAAGVVLAIVLEGILRLARSWIGYWIDAKFENTISNKAFGHILHMPLMTYEKHNAGTFLENLMAIRALKDFYSGQVVITLLDIPFVLIFLLLMSYLGTFLVLLPLLAIGLCGFLSLKLGRDLSESLAERQISNNHVSDYLLEVFSNLHQIEAMAIEAPTLRRYERLQTSCGASDEQLGRAAAKANLLSNCAAQVTTVLVALLGALLVIYGWMTIGALAACVLLTGRILQPLSRALNVWARMQTVEQAELRLQAIDHLPQEAKHTTSIILDSAVEMLSVT